MKNKLNQPNPTLEEVIKEWEDDQWIWSYDEKDNTVIHLWRKYYYVTDHIDINLKYKEIEINFSKLTIELLERLTKTFRALGWEAKDVE